MPDIPSYRFRAYSALFDDRRSRSSVASIPHTMSQQSHLSTLSQSSGISFARRSRASSLNAAAASSLLNEGTPGDLTLTSDAHTIAEEPIEIRTPRVCWRQYTEIAVAQV